MDRDAIDLDLNFLAANVGAANPVDLFLAQAACTAALNNAKAHLAEHGVYPAPITRESVEKTEGLVQRVEAELRSRGWKGN
jgi:hypothetical protein